MSNPARDLRFVCGACGHVHLKWGARCSSCLLVKGLEPRILSELAEEETAVPQILTKEPQEEAPRPRLRIARAPAPELPDHDPEEERVGPESPVPVPISEIAEATFVRDSTGLAPLDHVLGGGLVEASVVLLASPPGIGKSSLTLQALVGLRHRSLYVTGEETREQLAATARRIGAVSDHLYVLAETKLIRIFEHALSIRAQTLAIDSIQKMLCEDANGRPGSTAQIKECAEQLRAFAKKNAVAVWIIGHVTSDGDISGPKTLEHDVDVVLELDAGKELESNERILRCPTKNRFGATNVVGRFELTGKGFVPIDLDGWNEPL